MAVPKPTLLIACGALAREVKHLVDANGWNGFELTCLPADLHNRPDRIPDALRGKIREARDTGRYGNILALYGDCGTGGLLDTMLAEEGVERIPGAHCYEFFAGSDAFASLVEEEIGSFYLTEYLVRFFDRLIIKGLGIDRHPELLEAYFGNYKRIVYLAQTEDPELETMAQAAADRLGLALVVRKVGYGELATFMNHRAEDADHGEPDNRLLA